MLTRESLLKKGRLKKEKVEFNDTDFVYVREMTGKEKEIWERSLIDEKKMITDEIGKKSREEIMATAANSITLEDFKANMAVQTICKHDGTLVFKPEDAKTLNENIPASWLDKIVIVAQKLNKVTPEDREKLLKN